jgi:protein-S-isoprenylcysteine O-methyltransferase Ste14
VGTTAYILIGIQFEEHDLMRFLGEDYEDYRQRVPMLIPFTKKRRARTNTV